MPVESTGNPQEPGSGSPALGILRGRAATRRSTLKRPLDVGGLRKLHLSRVGLRSNKPIGERLDGPVALAGAFPQRLEIEQADVPPLVFYEASLLEGIGNDRHARPSHA